MKIRKITIKSNEYPDNLRHIYEPPGEFFASGEILPCDANAVAIVGTRRSTRYGTEEAGKLAYELAIRGITVISGMARGIDTAAHRGAIQAGGRTIAVMGSGHNNIYPPENRPLAETIAASGAVVSEFTPDTLPARENFPKRNRIISGMSKGVVVIEAPERSGALITANFALEEGREVFAMPGNINSAKNTGSNRLIKEGARLVDGVEDILDELKNVLDVRDAPNCKRVTRDCSPKAAPCMPAEEEAVFGILGDRPKSIDEISSVMDLPVSRVTDALLKLQLKRLARALPGENFVRL